MHARNQHDLSIVDHLVHKACCTFSMSNLKFSMLQKDGESNSVSHPNLWPFFCLLGFVVGPTQLCAQSLYNTKYK